jgi:hypothetical protein
MDQHFFDAFLGAIFGGIVTIAITIVLERMRSPRLQMSVGDCIEIPPRPPAFAANWKSLRVAVSNRRLNGAVEWWLARLPAQQCRASISFHRLNGTLFIAEPMAGRWAGGSPEPLVAFVQTPNGGTVPVLTNPQEIKSTVDIYPGEVEQLDIAIRVSGENEAYGWNNDTYFHQNWRNPNRQLNQQIYLVRLVVTSSGPKCTRWFRIDNDGPFGSFRLSDLTADERRVVGV